MTGADSVYRCLWRHKVFIVTTVAAFVAAGWYLTSRQTPLYKASVLVRVQQRITNAGEAVGALQAGQLLARTYADIVKTRAISDRVYRSFDGALPRSAIHLSASPVQDLGLLWISASSPDPRVAARVANAAPPALRSFITATGTLRDEIVVVDDAAPPTSAYSPRWALNLALAVLIGLLLATIVALVYDVLSDRLPDADALAEELDTPVLATIPPLEFRRPKAPAGQAVRAEEPREGASIA